MSIFSSSDSSADLDLVARLGQHRALGTAPREELAWLAANGALRSYRAGDVTTRKAQPEEWLQIVLSGNLAIHVDRGAGSRRIIAWHSGDVCGLMPYSRGGAPPGDTVAEAPTDTLAVHRDRLPEMIRECPRVTAALVHAMLDRARHFTSSDHLDEKLVSLGKLAAGLAHELNNPASAAVRGTKLLATSLTEAASATAALEAARLSDAQLELVAGVRALCASSGASRWGNALERADREDAVTAWLEAHGVGAEIAATLAETEVTLGALDDLAGVLPGGALAAALRSIAAGCVVRALAAEIEASVSRIYELVAAVKGFTYMDRAPTPEPVDIRPGIRDTFAMVAAKTRAKSVAVDVDLPSQLPQVRGFGGELNQVWLNLIDNALDAVATSGRIVVTANRELERVVVRIVDDGAGIAPEIRGQIFDPFFTTKPVGQGTGMGLDIVRRLIQRHDGEIDVDSHPGRTEFRVSLPIATL